jgi:eukaryotic-like serine/threonine-protein kinase
MGMILAGMDVVRFLTRTQFSRLYQGRDPYLQRDVVIKVFAVPRNHPVPPLTHGQWLRRFHQEGLAMARLDHPNIIPILRGGWLSDGRPFHVVPYFPANLPGIIGWDAGRADFGQMTDQQRPKALTPSLSIKVLGQIFAGLAHMHARGMVHRDIKPNNILLTSRQAMGVRITDFGMVKMGDDPDLVNGEWIGTKAYMAPEQERAACDVTDRADIYSACTLGLRLLSGFLPDQNEPMPPGVPSDLISLLRQGRSDHPDQRPSAAEMFSALGRCSRNGNSG